MTLPILIYMPYFESTGRGVKEAQYESVMFFENLKKKRLNWTYIFDRLTSFREDRLPFFKKIWTQYTILMIESTKVPTLNQIDKLIECPYPLCSQDYHTNLLLQDGSIFEFPAHKLISDHKITDLRQGCMLESDIYLKYCNVTDDFADVSDLGIIKISKTFQELHPNPNFDYDELGYRYNDVERLHRFLFSIGAKWHRHKELAKRNELFHIKNAGHESEYLTYDQYLRFIHRSPTNRL